MRDRWLSDVGNTSMAGQDVGGTSNVALQLYGVRWLWWLAISLLFSSIQHNI